MKCPDEACWADAEFSAAVVEGGHEGTGVIQPTNVTPPSCLWRTLLSHRVARYEIPATGTPSRKLTQDPIENDCTHSPV